MNNPTDKRQWQEPVLVDLNAVSQTQDRTYRVPATGKTPALTETTIRNYGSGSPSYAENEFTYFGPDTT